MTEALHTTLVSALASAQINPALSEDEVAGYPYVTFELPTEIRYTKDAPYMIVGNLTIRAVSDDFDEAYALRSGIEGALEEGFSAPGFSARLVDVREDCMDGIWIIELDYTLKQY